MHALHISSACKWLPVMYMVSQPLNCKGAWPESAHAHESAMSIALPQLCVLRLLHGPVALEEVLGLAIAPCRSLCIIDEFGKGTLAADGVGFFCSVLRHFSRMQPPPKVIAATHFSEVFDEAYLARQALSALCNVYTIAFFMF